MPHAHHVDDMSPRHEPLCCPPRNACLFEPLPNPSCHASHKSMPTHHACLQREEQDACPAFTSCHAMSVCQPVSPAPAMPLLSPCPALPVPGHAVQVCPASHQPCQERMIMKEKWHGWMTKMVEFWVGQITSLLSFSSFSSYIVLSRHIIINFRLLSFFIYLSDYHYFLSFSLLLQHIIT